MRRMWLQCQPPVWRVTRRFMASMQSTQRGCDTATLTILTPPDLSYEILDTLYEARYYVHTGM